MTSSRRQLVISHDHQIYKLLTILHTVDQLFYIQYPIYRYRSINVTFTVTGVTVTLPLPALPLLYRYRYHGIYSLRPLTIVDYRTIGI